MNFTICKSLDDCTCENCMSNRNRSELELRIRKEAMDAVGNLEAELFKMQTIENVKYMKIIKDRLNLPWGE